MTHSSSAMHRLWFYLFNQRVFNMKPHESLECRLLSQGSPWINFLLASFFDFIKKSVFQTVESSELDFSQRTCLCKQIVPRGVFSIPLPMLVYLTWQEGHLFSINNTKLLINPHISDMWRSTCYLTIYFCVLFIFFFFFKYIYMQTQF